MSYTLQQAAEAAQLLIDRRKTDPLYLWKPHTKQVIFLMSQASEAWFLAANRAGKSFALAACASSFARFGRLNPIDVYSGKAPAVIEPRRIWMVGLSHTLLNQTIMPMIFDNGFTVNGKPFIPSEEVADFHQKNGILRLKNGSQITFMSCDSGRDKFQGAAVDLVCFDEAPPLQIFNECSIRLTAGRPLLIRGACTLLPPEGVTTSPGWLFEQRVKPFKEAKKEGKSTKFDLVGASLRDNPFLSKEQIAEAETRWKVGTVDRAVRVEGEWIAQAFGQTVYRAFYRAIHVNPKLSPRTLQFRLPLLVSFKVNAKPLCAVIGQEVNGVLRILDEIYLDKESGNSLVELGQEFRRRYPVHGAEIRVYGDATSNQKKGTTAKSDYDMFLNELVGVPYPVVKCVPDTNPFERDRINAVNFALRGPGGSVTLEIAQNCKELAADLEEVLANVNGGILESKHPADPYFNRTHMSDSLGFLVHTMRPVFVDDRKPRNLLVQRTRVPGYTFGTAEVGGGSPSAASKRRYGADTWQ